MRHITIRFAYFSPAFN